MKPVIQIWIKEKGLDQIARDRYPSTWWRQAPSDTDAICISVSLDWFVAMRDYEAELGDSETWMMDGTVGEAETALKNQKAYIRDMELEYRKGNLHIREYEDKLTVHTDKVDPRTDPMGHLIHDAQEVLVGLAGAAVSGAAIGSYIYKIKKNSPYRKQQAVIGGLAASLAAGYASYKISKKIKEKMD